MHTNKTHRSWDEEQVQMSSFTELGELLHREHFQMINWVCDLQIKIAGDVSEYEYGFDEEDEDGALRSLKSSLDDVMFHHAFEEDMLFPLLNDHGERDLARLLVDDHALIEPITCRLQAITEEMLNRGIDRHLWAAFRKVSRYLVAEMLSHLVREEMVVVQRLDVLLDSDTDRLLARQHVAERAASCGIRQARAMH
ncbi:MAG: hemerythrin domain-containing protein [Rhodospirillales bacterium]|nr:hemerythrin domain-containing protein [Rhodospirillales bacterium]